MSIRFFIGHYLDAPMTWLFPALQPAPSMDTSGLVSAEFQGQWWILGIALVSLLFNYFLGVALPWHGVLLPRTQGVFGKYDWVANAVLFGLYHLHRLWSLPSVIASNLTYSWPARLFRSNWIAVIVHGAELRPPLVMVLAVILGLVTGQTTQDLADQRLDDKEAPCTPLPSSWQTVSADAAVPVRARH